MGPLMSDVGAEQLKRVIEIQHGGTATFLQTLRVHEAVDKDGLWDGQVHVFDLKDHPSAKRAYAWSSIIHGSSTSRFFAVLHQGRVTGPLQAVRAASAAIQKWGGPTKPAG
jgi:hypothetical protein